MGDPSKLSRVQGTSKGLWPTFVESSSFETPGIVRLISSSNARSRIQRKYKDILFGFPFARQAQAVDQSLWSDTSYALIAQYRSRIDPIRASPPGNKNAVENRKMLQKFLAFLGAEGTFWSGIVSRLVRIHGLTEANGAMVALGMNIVEFENRESLARQGQIDMAPAALEDNPTPTHPPPSHEHRSNKLLVVFRALIYLGDIARYREQYGTHPNKANSEPSTKRSRGGRRGKGGGAEKLNEKPFSKAEAFYVQARLLLPDYGNPFNQLAIVHSYQHDFFGAALNYYRALCVRKPFPTAQDNLIRRKEGSKKLVATIQAKEKAKQSQPGSLRQTTTPPKISRVDSNRM
ncbi:EST1 domain-containing protein [Rhizoctonia solani AG-1 IA]|uniref:EST1 domain-containing protein n=1 Tax=Thanatephorus cucumeris (strain AG1-IA) TaxID=983506 RepID=L8WXP5_THACA|nr:EST1 domain-containing protein [Rhizoctonia solani AG-1 IA]